MGLAYIFTKRFFYNETTKVLTPKSGNGTAAGIVGLL